MFMLLKHHIQPPPAVLSLLLWGEADNQRKTFNKGEEFLSEQLEPAYNIVFPTKHLPNLNQLFIQMRFVQCR